MGVSRQAHYQRLECAREHAQRYTEVIERVDEIRLRQPRIGTRKLQHLLQQPNGLQMGRDALFGVLRNARRLVPTGVRTTRPPTAITVAASIRICSRPAAGSSRPVENKSGWRISPICRREKSVSI